MRLLFSLILILLVFSCESDDICAESTNSTPRLIITFYDAENIETRKDVEDLAIYAIKDGQLTLMNEINGITTDSINIPLRNDQSVSNFKFYKDDIPAKVDIDYEALDYFKELDRQYKKTAT